MPSSAGQGYSAPDEHLPIPEQGRYLLLLNGFYNYYAVPTNFRALTPFITTCSPTGCVASGGAATVTG
jgi:hypothetical protein